jgi:acid stress chaperone HdeA
MNRAKIVVLSAVSAVAFLSGCSQVAEVTTKGGETTCGDYVGFDEKKQNETITKMLTDEGKNEPGNAELTGTRLSITTYCQVAGNQESQIQQAPHL